MNKAQLIKDCPQDHPAALSKNYSKRNFIFCDDSDDRFNRHYHDEFKAPEGLSKTDYITWASILVNSDNMESVLSDIKFVKDRWSVGKIHFSGNDGKQFHDLFYRNDLFRKNFFDLIEKLKGQYYFSSILNSRNNFDKIIPEVLEDFGQINEEVWKDPKFVSLYWHLIKLDRFLPESDSEYYSYTDRIPSVDKKIDQTTGWYGKSHHHLHKINGLICFKTNISDGDEMSVLLELADFVTSSIRRTFQSIRSQDTRAFELSDEEISNRIASIKSPSEQSLVRFTLDMLRTHRYELLDPIVCGSFSDGELIKL